VRATNARDRINDEFRRRTKTKAMLSSEDAAVLLLFDLLHSGAITSRRLAARSSSRWDRDPGGSRPHDLREAHDRGSLKSKLLIVQETGEL
jgi:hypothetical protein